MNLLPATPPRETDPRYIPRLVDSSWIVLDRVTGAPLNRARYTVEIQARWTAEAMNEAYRMGKEAAHSIQENDPDAQAHSPREVPAKGRM